MNEMRKHALQILYSHTALGVPLDVFEETLLCQRSVWPERLPCCVCDRILLQIKSLVKLRFIKISQECGVEFRELVRVGEVVRGRGWRLDLDELEGHRGRHRLSVNLFCQGIVRERSQWRQFA
jgi:hypothetical protein